MTLSPLPLATVAQRAKLSYTERLTSESGVGWWDAVILTASSERQADSYREEIQRRRQLGHVPQRSTFLVVADPGGRRIGSGGATIHALHQYLDQSDPGWRQRPLQDLTEWWNRHRVLIIHSGGDSRRLPQYSLSGKLFSALPVRLISGEASTVFDEMLALSLDWLNQMTTGGVLVSSGDVVLVFDSSNLGWDRPGVCGVGLLESPEVGAGHGVYVTDERGTVYNFLQKPSETELRNAGGIFADGRVAVDTGLLRFDPSASAKLSGSSVPGGGEPQLDLYTHLTMTLTGLWRPAATDSVARRNLYQRMAGTPFFCSLVDGQFTHIGTTRLFRSLMTEDAGLPNLYAEHQRLRGGSWPGVHSDGVVIDSVLDRGEVGLGAVVLECSLPGKIQAARGAVLHGLNGLDSDIDVPEDTVIHQIPVRVPSGETGTVIRTYGVMDDPKAAGSSATWFGRSLSGVLEELGLDAALAWPALSQDRTLWNAELFPVTTPSEAWQFARWFMTGEDAGASLIERWKALPRCSLSSSAALADNVALAQFRSRRSSLQWEQSAVALARAESDLRPMLVSTPGVDAIAQVAQRLEKLALGSSNVSQAASYLYQGSRFLEEAGQTERSRELRDRAFTVLASGLREQVAATQPLLRQAFWQYASVRVSAPARIDFGGGWSDTPPFCVDWGGTVLNSAVALEGDYPITARVDRLDEPVLRCIAAGQRTEWRTDEDVAEAMAPGHAFAIPRAALRVCGFWTGQTFKAALEAAGGGLEIELQSGLPVGSGLGTSSILSGALLQALAAMAGRAVDPQSLTDLVLQLEQEMGSGGGWQDQAGGIYPGVKLLSTGPGLQQRIRFQAVGWSLEREAQFERRVVLIHTGIARVARNLLQQVVGKYLAREARAVQVLHSIKTLALEMSFAMREGDWPYLGALLDRHWELNQQLDPNTINAPIAAMLQQARPWIHGAKLAGAGGGGYLILLAKDEEAALELRRRFSAVDWQIARDGLRIHRRTTAAPPQH